MLDDSATALRLPWDYPAVTVRLTITSKNHRVQKKSSQLERLLSVCIIAAKVAINLIHTKKNSKKFGGIKENAGGQGFFN